MDIALTCHEGIVWVASDWKQTFHSPGASPAQPATGLGVQSSQDWAWVREPKHIQHAKTMHTGSALRIAPDASNVRCRTDVLMLPPVSQIAQKWRKSENVNSPAIVKCAELLKRAWDFRQPGRSIYPEGPRWPEGNHKCFFRGPRLEKQHDVISNREQSHINTGLNHTARRILGSASHLADSNVLFAVMLNVILEQLLYLKPNLMKCHSWMVAMADTSGLSHYGRSHH
jgi:hypothetical protein